MCGKLVKTEISKRINDENNIKKENARYCSYCKFNVDGYCNRMEAWCSKVNSECKELSKRNSMSVQERKFKEILEIRQKQVEKQRKNHMKNKNR